MEGLEGQVDDAMTEGQPVSLVTTQHYHVLTRFEEGDQVQDPSDFMVDCIDSIYFILFSIFPLSVRPVYAACERAMPQNSLRWTDRVWGNCIRNGPRPEKVTGRSPWGHGNRPIFYCVSFCWFMTVDSQIRAGKSRLQIINLRLRLSE